MTRYKRMRGFRALWIPGADHAGLKLKTEIIKFLKREKIVFTDFGTFSDIKVDYPDFAFVVANNVAMNNNSLGVLICGTGTGMVIAANKVKGVRAAVIYDKFSARMAREHNNVNIACLRGRNFSVKKSLKVFKVWLNADFSGESRHTRRIKKIAYYEDKNCKACA